MEKAPNDLPNLLKDISIIILDIEGTTTSISFVKEVLFSYVLREVGQHLETTWLTEETKKDVAALKRQNEEDVAAGVSGVVLWPDNIEMKVVIPCLVRDVCNMVEQDRKVGPLKTLQGHMWRRAYQQGTIKGHVYEDVPGALKAWHEEGKKVVIYSSGSVEAQKLLFKHSCHGDILHYLSDHFDTGIGAKGESDSYLNILKSLQSPSPATVLFITDVAKEAQAATEAGLQVVLSVREGTKPLTTQDLETYPTITTFTQLL
ncbi:hypothetical protein Pmani_009405 [Petrolisthes manimaculis]|uniref:Enolase-phosphatase E1 n=1 Tax=Petrolisthes manimaculis TaxID=1843537 RepID=A0AAE1UCW4_9EUCA|nr:hypothetical protein Pmani_009405 [Petrolisthes manimaculis]